VGLFDDRRNTMPRPLALLIAIVAVAYYVKQSWDNLPPDQQDVIGLINHAPAMLGVAAIAIVALIIQALRALRPAARGDAAPTNATPANPQRVAVGVAAGLLALNALAVGLVLLPNHLREYVLAERGIATSALVSRQYTTRGKRSINYHVQYMFDTREGHRVYGDDTVSLADNDQLWPGAPLRILYDPTDAERSEINIHDNAAQRAAASGRFALLFGSGMLAVTALAALFAYVRAKARIG